MFGLRSTIVVLVAAWSLIAAVGASAQSAPAVVGAYGGQIPFDCQLQDVGTGTDFPDPGADPMCVEFDKTNQNFTDFGLVEFTAQEPARVAAAADKCFYFQRDHWTGSVVQGQQPETWNWDGNYFFDRARGVGGVSVRNFRIGGSPQSAGPFAPAAYRPYFDEAGGGGVEVLMDSGPDPSCAAKVDTPEERDRVYGARGLYPGCVAPGGRLKGRRVGPVRLRMSRDRVLARLGPPQDFSRRVDRWCLIGKGELRIVYGHAATAKAILTSGRGQSARGVARGDRARRAHRRLNLRPAGRAAGTRVFEARNSGRRRLWLGTADGRVRWLVIAGRQAKLSHKRFSRLVSDVA